MYNSYFGNNQYTNPNQYYGYQPIQMQQRQIQPQQVMSTEEVPFNDIKFVTEDEAKAYIVLPNTKVMLMDRDKSIFYIKSADSLGKSTLEGYKYTKLENTSTEPVSLQIDTKDFVKTDDLKSFITKDDLSGFLTKEDIKNFITRDDLKHILSGGETNGN